MRICLVGPCSPIDCTVMMDESSKARVAAIGYRGLPVSLLAEALWRAGHDVTVLTTAPGQSGHFSGIRFNLYQVPSRIRGRDRAFDFFRLERQQLIEIMRDHNFDVIHAHWTYEFALAALQVDRKSLVTAHDSPFTVLRYLPDPYRAARLAMALRVASLRPRLTAVSPYLAQKLRDHGLTRGEVPIVSNIARTSPYSKQETAHEQGAGVVVGYIGSFDRRKNVEKLVIACSTLAQQGILDRLILVGSRTGNVRIDKLIEHHSLRNYVEFTGELSGKDFWDCLSEMDIFVNPSLEETQSLALMEAMTLAIPCIGGQSSGAVPWTLDYGRAGFLVDVTQPKRIADAIRWIKVDAANATAIANCGRQLVADRAAPDTVAKEYESIYGRILSED